MRHYMPGCDVAKNHPREIKAIQHYMVEKKQAVIDRCCRVSNKLLETGDIIINNCTLCELMLRETHPNNQIISLYEYVLSDPEFPWADFEGLCLTVQDCWRTRNNRQMQDAIRECLVRMHVQIIETEENYEKTKFDGMWLFGNPRQDCVDTAPVICKDIMENYVEPLPEDEQIARMKDWVSRYSTEQVLVYCNGCERGIRVGGGHPIHLVELLAKGLM